MIFYHKSPFQVLHDRIRDWPPEVRAAHAFVISPLAVAELRKLYGSVPEEIRGVQIVVDPRASDHALDVVLVKYMETKSDDGQVFMWTPESLDVHFEPWWTSGWDIK